jgi:glycosyltransferase involved in cell wall biosynthesis
LKDTKKLLAIPNCLPFEHTLTHEEIEAKGKTALVVGRMVDFPKRISLILKMWQTIEQNPIAKDWNLEIVGDGPDLETYKSLANKLGLLHCTFHGRRDPIDYYRHASLFFMTSEFEGFPMTLVEAQMMGCVPVAFDTFDSLKEVVTDKENGRIIPNNDTEKYVDTVIELMNSSDTRLKLVQNGLNNCQRYSQQTICNRWKSLIESLVVSR